MADASDDKTVVKAAPAAPAPAETPHNTLPVGTRLGEFEIVGLVGEGGFGIVYLAQDHSLQRKVALKEYMPSSLASRGQDSSVIVRSERHRETFEIGLRSFVNEARLLAQFDHPALVKVYRFWEANSTAYMAMPYYTGKTLRDVLKERTTPPDESWIRKILMPVMEALEVIHGDHCYHRDIAPDNIMLLSDERPVLLDFGAARRVISDMTQALTVILKPGYAPIEQYAEMPGMKQGPWTDVYALAAVVYFMIMRRTPPPSVGRMMQDSYQPLATDAAGRYSDTFLRGIDRCLTVKAEGRPQSIGEMREVLGFALDHPLFAAPGATRFEAPSKAAPSAKKPPKTVIPQQPTDAADAPKKSRTGLIVAAATVLGLGAAGGAYIFLGPGKSGSGNTAGVNPPPAASAPSAAGASAQASAPIAPPPAASAVAVQPPPAATETVATKPPETDKPVVAQQPAFASFDEALGALASASDSAYDLKLVTQPSIQIGSKLKLSLTSKVAGFVYLFLWDKGEDRVYRLFPNAADGDNAIKPGTSFSVPRIKLAQPWGYTAMEPAGDWRVIAMVSERPRDFSSSAYGERGEFLVASRKDLERQLAAHTGLATFIGKPECAGAATCDEHYAASVVAIAEVAAPAAKASPPPSQTTTPSVPKKAPATPVEPKQVDSTDAAKPARKPQSGSTDQGTDAEREYMKQLNKDLDKLLGK